jgi:hypothetical protein
MIAKGVETLYGTLNSIENVEYQLKVELVEIQESLSMVVDKVKKSRNVGGDC